MTTSLALIVAGGVVQVAGFGLALRQSVATRRELSPGEASLAAWTQALVGAITRKAATWVRVKTEPVLIRLHLRGPRTVSVEAKLTTGATMTVRGHKAIDNHDKPLEDRVELLERELNDLHRKQSDLRADHEERIEELRKGVEDRESARDSERARQLGRRLRAEELGVVVFVVGVVLTIVGAAV